MSCWDVTVYRFPREIASIEQLLENTPLPAIATRAEVAQSLKQLFPEVDTSDLSWLVLDDHEFKIEINTGHEEPCAGFTLHVRGSDRAVTAVMRIAQHFDARAFDMTACQFLDDMSDPSSGFKQWQTYIHRVVGATELTASN